MKISGEYVYGIIYKITNKVNGKSYIGQTKDNRGFKGRYYHRGSTNAERVYLYHKRMKELNGYYNVHLLSAMEKYGYQSFDVCEVLDTAMSQEELDQKEIDYINYYDSYNNGYNANRGGDGNVGHKQPKGKDNPFSTPICQLTLDGKFIKEWDSFADIKRSKQYNVPNIELVCNGKNTRAYNCLWVYKKDYDPNKKYTWNPPSCYRKIVMLDNDGNIINEFNSVSECSRLLHVDRKTVRDTCNNVWMNPTYNLKYKDEYMEEQRLSGETSLE